MKEAIDIPGAQVQIRNWLSQIKSTPSITESDAEELKSHLMDMMDHFKDAGLNDDEAFLIASRRIGKVTELQDEYLQANDWVLTLRMASVLMAGVLAYFLFYHLSVSLFRLLFISLLHSEINGYIAALWYSRCLTAIHIVFIVFFLLIYFRKMNVVSLIENTRLKPKYLILLILGVVIFAISGSYLTTVYESMLGENLFVRGRMNSYNSYFGLSFPTMICICFLFIYSKFYKPLKT